jgi:ABC-2 type transport system permease protein
MSEVIARPRTEAALIRTVRRSVAAYSAIASIALKDAFAYTLRVWVQFVIQFITIVVFIYFWRAVYAGRDSTLGGLDLRQTLNYVILAQILVPLWEAGYLGFFGYLLRQGQMSLELLRPIDFQIQIYIRQLALWLYFVLQRLPLVLFAWLFFGLQLPSNPWVWVAFMISLLFGQAVVFFFEWCLACLAFYTTEVHGLYQTRTALARFLSGSLVPLALMPAWLQAVTGVFPFAQAVSVPISLLIGITPLAEAPRVWLIQLLWVVGLGVLSRLIFRVAIRQVTVQGG